MTCILVPFYIGFISFFWLHYIGFISKVRNSYGININFTKEKKCYTLTPTVLHIIQDQNIFVQN